MVACPKPEPARKAKRRRYVADRKVARAVRAACVERDGACRLSPLSIYAWTPTLEDGAAIFALVGPCEGRSEWSHLAGHRRSQTLRRPPEQRHSTEWTAMLCTRHGRMEEDDLIAIVPLTAHGLDGDIRAEHKAAKSAMAWTMRA